ncbi:MAG: hypothetical protein WC852_03700 [Candidatus Nanoarchaeia archaeon]|jgi:hypothetical protein
MDKLKQLITEANTELKKADHLAYVTYPMIRESKLLYAIAEVLYNSLYKGVEAVLAYERLYKRIPLVPGTFETEIELFKDVSTRYGFSRSIVLLLLDLRRLVKAKKESPVEFVRKDKFVICDDDYNMSVLDINKIKAYVMDSKEFMEKLNHVMKSVK